MHSSSEPSSERRMSVDMGRLVAVTWRERWRVLAVAATAAVVGAIWSLTMSPVFRAYALLAPPAKDQDGGLLGLAGQFAGMGELAGISLGGRSNLDETLAFVTSQGFTIRFLREAKLEPLVFPDRWDAARKAWKTGSELPLGDRLRNAVAGAAASLTGDPPPPAAAADGAPSDWELSERFEELRDIKRDKRTNIVNVAIAARTAADAARLTNEFVAQANRQLRERATTESRRAIDYLTSRVRDSQLVALNTALYRVMEQELRTEMLASLREDYALRVIDPARPPRIRDAPRRTAIVLASGVIGGFLGVLWVLVRASRRREL